MSDVAAFKAAEDGHKPLVIWKAEDATHVPFLGDYVPAGWRPALWADMYTTPRVGGYWREDEEATFMVDSSGFGARDEPALTLIEFRDYIMQSQRPQHTYGWAIREAGQFQIVVGVYIQDASAPGTEAPSRESVECEDCHEVHGPFDECEREYDDASYCPACGDVIDYCQGHGEIGDPAGFAILAAHDSDDHSRCEPNGCDNAGETIPAGQMKFDEVMS
jgi:hypothetical protein